MIADVGRSRMRFAVDGWDPNYGTSLEVEGDAEAPTQVIADVECDRARWSPIRPKEVAPPAATIFVDGVRRLEARIWIDEPAGAISEGGSDSDTDPTRRATEASAALCASYAAGSVCCCREGAHLLNAEVRRGLFTAATHATDLATWAGSYQVFPTVIKENQGLAISLSASLQHQLSTLEITTAVAARNQLREHGIPDRAELLVVDGPVRGRENLQRVLGFIKSHQIAYLEPRLHAMIGTLTAGERTPVFLLGTSWDRFSWYLRLPCLPGQPWAGIARVECAANLPSHEAIALADLSQAVLPRFASAEYKDARAPQNLYPVAGLERELRRRLGDSALLYRALRQAAFGS
jgi:hypothetical protein